MKCIDLNVLISKNLSLFVVFAGSTSVLFGSTCVLIALNNNNPQGPWTW